MTRVTVMAHITGQGGVACKTAELARALEDRGLSVTEVYFGQRPRHPGLDARLVKAAVYRSPTPVEVARALKLARPDVVIMAYSTILAAATLPIRTGKGPMFIGVVHGQGVLFSNHSPAGQTVLSKASVPLLHSLDQLICVNQTLALTVVERGMDPSRVHVIHNGIFSADIPLHTRGDGSLLFAGSLHPEKRLDLLFEALNRWPGNDTAPPLCILGHGPERDKLEQTAVKQGVRVRFEGWVDDAVDRIAKASVVVLPSDSEGFPSVLLEAAVCQTPMVVSDIPGNRAVLGPHSLKNALFFKPGMSKDLARKLQQCFEDREASEERASRARTHVISNFDWSICSDHYIEIVNKCKGGRR